MFWEDEEDKPPVIKPQPVQDSIRINEDKSPFMEDKSPVPEEPKEPEER